MNWREEAHRLALNGLNHIQIYEQLEKDIDAPSRNAGLKRVKRELKTPISHDMPIIENYEPVHHSCTWHGSNHIRFALMGDTQFNSKYTQITYLHDFYKKCKDLGITKVYHTGDIDDGEQMRIGHQYECYTQGADEHAEEIIKNYPQVDGITTYFITGNHDASIYKKCGVDIGKMIATQRKDMVYLGRDCAVINLTPNCKLELRHPWDGSCFDDTTEIFTKRGWVLFKDLTEDDVVATMTKDTFTFEWQKPNIITSVPYTGKMYCFKSRTVDMMVTPNHHLWARIYPKYVSRKENPQMPQKGHCTLSTDWQAITAEDLVDSYAHQKWQFTNVCNSWVGIKNSDFVEIPRLDSKNPGMADKMQHFGSIALKDAVELIAWFVTEGCAREKEVSICQSERVNPENHKKICDLFERIGARYSYSGIDNKNITIHSKELSSWLVSECNNGSYNKKLPRWLLDLPTEYLQIAFDTMIDGDGWVNGKGFGYRSVSEQLLFGIQEIAIKLGYAVHQRGEVVNFIKEQTTPTINKVPEQVEYDGIVYCCQVENGLILVRRNGGSATWSHNSYALSYKMQKMIDSMSEDEKPDILAVGHYHKIEYLYYGGVHAFQTGCFQSQTPFTRGKGISVAMGGWIVDVEVDNDGKLISLQSKLIPYSKGIQNDYKNFV